MSNQVREFVMSDEGVKLVDVYMGRQRPTPTLIRIDPPPAIRLAGDISNTNRVLALLGISPR